MGGRLGRAFRLLIDGYLDGNVYPLASAQLTTTGDPVIYR